MAEPYVIKTGDEKAFRVHIKDLLVEGRERKEFKNLEALRESIKEVGLIEPIIIMEIPGGKFRLLAGERRYRACLQLGSVEIPAVSWKDIPKWQQAQIEFDENTKREAMTWQEQATLWKKITELKKAQFGDGSSIRDRSGTAQEGTWTIGKTAQLVNEDQGHVGKKIALAERMEADPQFKEATKNLPWTTAYQKMKQSEEADKLQRQVASGHVVLHASIRLGDSRELIREVPDNSVHLLCWDPPFGQGTITELEGKGAASGESSVQAYLKTLKASDNLDLPQAIKLIADLAPNLYRVMAPGAYFYIFHCSELYQPLVDIFRAHQFQIDPCPIIWDKGKATAPGRGYSYMPSYEPILLGVKPPWTRRLAKDMRNILTFPALSSAQKKHAFQKPPDLLNHIITQVTDPGQVVLDPCAGSGATIYAAEDAKRSGIGFEIDPQNFSASQVWGQERKAN